MHITFSKGIVESIYIYSGSDVCRIFINGYITSTKTIKGLAVGKRITLTGLSSIDENGPRIRVRDRDDIEVYTSSSSKDSTSVSISTTILDTRIPLADTMGRASVTATSTNNIASLSLDLTQAFGESISSLLVLFDDVSGWYSEYVDFLAARSIMNGKGNNSFDPMATITKAEVIQLLANYADVDLSNYNEKAFEDVDSTIWYGPAIAWAKEAGLITGSDGNFMPNDSITREELAILINDLYMYMENSALPELVASIDFLDISTLDSKAQSSIKSLQLRGIIIVHLST
jgi:hypothetical protein